MRTKFSKLCSHTPLSSEAREMLLSTFPAKNRRSNALPVVVYLVEEVRNLPSWRLWTRVREVLDVADEQATHPGHLLLSTFPRTMQTLDRYSKFADVT